MVFYLIIFRTFKLKTQTEELHGYGLEVPCEYHFEGDNFHAIG